VNTYQALKALNVKSESSWDEIKIAYRKIVLEFNHDKKTSEKEGN
jgi:DnaJ-class molecular chaperone